MRSADFDTAREPGSKLGANSYGRAPMPTGTVGSVPIAAGENPSRKRGRPKGHPKTGGRRRGSPNRIRKSDLLARIAALDHRLETLAQGIRDIAEPVRRGRPTRRCRPHSHSLM